MLQKVEVFSSNPSAPELPLAGLSPSSDPIFIRSIQGLEPVKAEIVTTPLATGRGETRQGSSTGKRNIVLSLGLNPDWVEQTMATLRQQLYRYFMPEEWCKLRFISDHLPTVDIEGYVESMDPNIFTEDPEYQISIICPQPDFVDVDATIYNGVVDDGTIELEFEYIGTVKTGFEVRIDRAVANPSYSGPIEIINKAPIDAQIIEIDPVVIDTLQYFKLNTTQGRRRLQSVDYADGSISNILDKMTGASVWPQLNPGQNIFSVAAEENGQTWMLAYFNRFGGL